LSQPDLAHDTEGQGWVNKVAGRVESTHRTQEAAADADRRMAKRLYSDHVMQDRASSPSEASKFVSIGFRISKTSRT